MTLKKNNSTPQNSSWQIDFLERNALEADYLTKAAQLFDPILHSQKLNLTLLKKPLVIGINGTQGSGKSTLADYLKSYACAEGLSAVSISLDDFYLTRKERFQLSRDTHPLLATRGVPGTHDIALAMRTLNRLSQKTGTATIPRFDKSRDDRYPKEHWEKAQLPVQLILLEGWCLGAKPQPDDSLKVPVNQFEKNHDANQAWREYVNNALAKNYQSLFEKVDQWVMLRAPSFDAVYKWRLHQEEKLKKKILTQGKPLPPEIMQPDEIKRFIEHYQRITETTLIDLPKRVHHLYHLDDLREITKYETPVA
ncbi:MAG: hypothetical protein CBC09_09915 [Cellvibrionales bacterium TMED49]|nr:hypothetical protein [Porticoccaceae bacterium]OUU34804.1 MAG: hypothetical protein CBC09_09915 [Cellvibrionales bacterium TMED49]